MVENLFPDNSPAVDVPCPACGAEVEVEVTYVVTPDSSEFQALFEGSLNQGYCQECGAEFVLATPLVYRDDNEHYLVYYMPLDDRNTWRDVEGRVAEMGERVFAEMPGPSRPKCRLTFHRRNFIEKIAAHSAGLDDRLLEYVKYQLYSRPSDPIDQIRSELLLDFSQRDEERLVFILFDRETGEATAAAHIPMETYDELDEAFHGDTGLDEELADLFPGPYVSVERLYD